MENKYTNVYIAEGARIGRNCIIGAGTLITQGKEVPEGSMVYGNPARVVRALTPEEIAHIRENADHYVRLSAPETTL